MTTIKASCPGCGDVELTSAQVRLVVCSIQDWSFYAFTCHTCHDEVRKPAASDVVTLLQSGGVLAEIWSVPAEAMESHDGTAISYDDVLDFALSLQALDDLTSPSPFRPGVPARYRAVPTRAVPPACGTVRPRARPIGQDAPSNWFWRNSAH